MNKLIAFFLLFSLLWLPGAPVEALPGDDVAAPSISWEVVQPGILGVTADDAESMPARLEVSLDGGRTWQAMEFPVPFVSPQVRTPSVTWNVELRPGLNHVQVRAFDGAGNTSQASTEIQND
jgi:hypothetical protein